MFLTRHLYYQNCNTQDTVIVISLTIKKSLLSCCYLDLIYWYIWCSVTTGYVLNTDNSEIVMLLEDCSPSLQIQPLQKWLIIWLTISENWFWNKGLALLWTDAFFSLLPVPHFLLFLLQGHKVFIVSKFYNS